MSRSVMGEAAGAMGDWGLSLAAEGVLNRHVASARPLRAIPQPGHGRELTLHVPHECAAVLRRAGALGDVALAVLIDHATTSEVSAAAPPQPALSARCAVPCGLAL
ncbi:hypothetical protein [Zavarzinia sp. CC-PAN008]|uniref:hypothetical protein n=1 Tax=Zavarzinia sp. CC-PAN008 TaxID=3243332 RepID=UPI003F7462B3